jgi:hypothetical protein
VTADSKDTSRRTQLFYRQSAWTRVTHWIWAVTELSSSLGKWPSGTTLYALFATSVCLRRHTLKQPVQHKRKALV